MKKNLILKLKILIIIYKFKSKIKKNRMHLNMQKKVNFQIHLKTSIFKIVIHKK